MNPSRTKLWRYKFRIAGKENLFAIGKCRSISLQDARDSPSVANLVSDAHLPSATTVNDLNHHIERPNPHPKHHRHIE
ncbi:Arm DNA-binding domain-containing protein [Burkholderia lata]|uniref:Arm DNA-binding domain-containing protein n=1 Tax=Burkholderia lata (strain ATCC 17760 / DSM 23089 / LMG 22485 / NCIMB 9086 / R18194 / 383) TaxID=482957 RepID=UPI003464334D